MTRKPVGVVHPSLTHSMSPSSPSLPLPLFFIKALKGTEARMAVYTLYISRALLHLPGRRYDQFGFGIWRPPKTLPLRTGLHSEPPRPSPTRARALRNLRRESAVSNHCVSLLSSFY